MEDIWERAMSNPAMSNVAGSPILSVKNLEAWYGESHILHGMNLEVRPGEVRCSAFSRRETQGQYSSAARFSSEGNASNI
jgi:hypothetical protein